MFSAAVCTCSRTSRQRETKTGNNTKYIYIYIFIIHVTIDLLAFVKRTQHFVFHFAAVRPFRHIDVKNNKVTFVPA